MSTTRGFLFVLLFFAVLAIPIQHANAAPSSCFAETGQCIDTTFVSFWQKNGGLPIFGYPIAPASTQIIEDMPIFVQYFERTRLELHIDNTGKTLITLGRIGAEIYGTVDYDGTSVDTNCLYFSQTNQSVCEPFRTTYLRYGLESNGKRGFQFAENVALFGMPIAKPQHVTLADGDYISQWFERARMLYKTDDSEPVSLGLIGRQRYTQEALSITANAESLPSTLTFTGNTSFLSEPLPLPLGEITLTVMPNSDATVQLIDGRGRLHTMFNAVTLINRTSSFFNDTGGVWYLSIQNTTKLWAVSLAPSATNQVHAFQYEGKGTVDSDLFQFTKDQYALYSVHYGGSGYFVMQMRCDGKTTTLVSMSGSGDASAVMHEVPGVCRWIIKGTGGFVIYRLKSL